MTSKAAYPKMTLAMRRSALALALTLLTGLCRAEGYRKGQFELSLNPGAYIPIGLTGSIMSPSAGVQLAAGYQFSNWGTAGFEFGYDPAHREGGVTTGRFSEDFNQDGTADVVGFSSDIKEKYLQFTPYFKLGQWLDVLQVRFRPYMIGGMGLYQEWFNGGTMTVAGKDQLTDKPVPTLFRPISSAGNAFLGINAGAGFEIQIDENAALGFDLRYARIFKPVYNAQFLIPSLRIMYLFGAEVDSRSRF